MTRVVPWLAKHARGRQHMRVECLEVLVDVVVGIRLELPHSPLDFLAQHRVAEVELVHWLDFPGRSSALLRQTCTRECCSNEAVILPCAIRQIYISINHTAAHVLEQVVLAANIIDPGNSVVARAPRVSGLIESVDGLHGIRLEQHPEEGAVLVL